MGLFTPILMLLTPLPCSSAPAVPPAPPSHGPGRQEAGRKDRQQQLYHAAALLGRPDHRLLRRRTHLLRLFGASDTTLPYALTYSRIYILGTICVLIVLGMNTFITAQGFAKISMLTTVIGAVINIVLDPILIFGLGMA